MLDSYLVFFLSFDEYLLNTCTVLGAGKKISSPALMELNL